MALRQIQPISTRGLTPRDPGPLPDLIWVSPEDLYVDETYQRTITQKSVAKIRSIIENFDWSKFKPPNVAETAAGYRVLDGQHGAIAALMHPTVSMIPVLVSVLPEVADQAAAFVSHARDRLEVTRTQTHLSAVVARDPAAIALDRVLSAHGITVRRNPPAMGKYAPGETMAVQTLYNLLRRRGPDGLSVIVNLLRTRAPITATELQALDLMLYDPDMRDDCTPEVVGPIVAASSGYEKKEAEEIATIHQKPVYRALALVWYRRVPRAKMKAPIVQLRRR